MSSEDSDFVDDIIGDKAPTHSEPAPEVFLPWHRVRKEYIRRHQWNELVIRMFKRRWKKQSLPDETKWLENDEEGSGEQVEIDTSLVERPIRCLVIPGQDLLDLRAMYRDLSQFNCWIRYLGGNESNDSEQEGTRVHIANNAVTSLDGVVKNSRVIRDRFETIAKPSSQAYRYLKEYGPYHIVNFDLCGSMFPNTVKSTQEYFAALLQLLAYQFENQKSEWLLFLTTMIEPSTIDQTAFKDLCKPARKNFDEHKDFAEQVTKLFPSEPFKAVDSTVNLTALSENELVQLFGVALGKWILALCHNARPQWTVAMRRSYSYPVNDDKGALMLSLAFELHPNVTPPTDPTGISGITIPERKYPGECECAVKLAVSVSGIRDVDCLLKSDKILWTRLRDAQAILLESAGYDLASYVAWTDAGEVISS